MVAVAKPTRADEVAEVLKRRILSGIYPAGTKLPAEFGLARELRVNRFTVREAMNQLEQLRLIQRKAGSGTLVLDYQQNAGLDVIEYLVLNERGVVDLGVLGNLLEVSRMLSSEVAALAAERRTDEELSTLAVIVARIQSEKRLSELLWLDFDFNWALASASHNVVPRLLLNSTRGLLRKYSHLLETLWVSPGSMTQGYEYVVDAVRARDAERTRSLVKWIWTGRHERFVEAVDRATNRRSAGTTSS
jgi:GntR family transcriptional regulator, transcriptional repressor for pyruvate dehydrogenase complex